MKKAMMVTTKSCFISVVVPCFNEEKNILGLTRLLIHEIQKYRDYEILFVEDGSRDQSIKTVKSLAFENRRIGYVQFSRNFGHQVALKAGLDHARGDCVITMDADMQHDPKYIHELIRVWREEGVDVVYTVRDDSGKRTLKTFFSSVFYRIINGVTSKPVYAGAADFRLLDRRVVDELRKISEHHLFLRGLIPWMGFRQKAIPIIVGERAAGESKYSAAKMVRLALSGITSFSIAPLRLALLLGGFFAFLSFLYGGYALWVWLFTEQAVPGWTSIIASILFLSGIQMMLTGIVGEYVGKTFEQVKQRPGYIIKEKNIPQGDR
ncbi:MAG: glycosyltransferase family 2 protein [Balneolaceae bacterium]|nr:glycosyltransferase family 2 protein [Balneolaceae bacterium]